jgi:iron-sulfur cluster repair protein YtfE (RIC family)
MARLCPQLRRLQAEHQRWLLQSGRRAVPGGQGGRETDAAWAARLLALFDGEIVAHLRSEEEVLLPELSRRIPESDAVLVFTLGDHVVLRRLARALREAAPDALGALLLQFTGKLAEHAAFEEETLFPILQTEVGTARLAGVEGELAAQPPRRRSSK